MFIIANMCLLVLLSSIIIIELINGIVVQIRRIGDSIVFHRGKYPFANHKWLYIIWVLQSINIIHGVTYTSGISDHNCHYSLSLLLVKQCAVSRGTFPSDTGEPDRGLVKVESHMGFGFDPPICSYNVSLPLVFLFCSFIPRFEWFRRTWGD